jgi:hypothetical protein
MSQQEVSALSIQNLDQPVENFLNETAFLYVQWAWKWNDSMYIKVRPIFQSDKKNELS